MLIDLELLIPKYNMTITGVVVIGAHQGQEYKTFKKLNINNIVFFEPQPHVFKDLKENVGKEAILYQTALGNFEGNVEMFTETANNGQSSSILSPSLHLIQYPHITFNNKVTVPINKLDNYIQHSDQCNFMLVDVQGYELEVFKGSEKFLNKIDYIICEVNRDEVYKNCAQVNEIDDFLKKFGFKRSETNWVGTTWGDAFYIKANK